MPLSEISLNRDRGWSLGSVDSMEDSVVFSSSGTRHPHRQPLNAPSETRVQSDDGFARFLKQHSSPTHQRVTAGGRIVPMEPIPAPPQFNLLIDNLARGKNSASQKKMADDPKMSNKRSTPVLSSTATANNDLPSACAGQNPQTVNSTQENLDSVSANAQVNTTVIDLANGNRMPRHPDLTHVTTANTTGLSQAFTNFASPFNLNPQTLPHNQWGSFALPLSGLVLNPYANTLVPGGEQQPTMPTMMVSNAPFSSVSDADQMSLPIARSDDLGRIDQQSLHPGFWPNFNPLMPLNPTVDRPLSHPDSASLMNATASFGPPHGDLPLQIGTQIGTHPQLSYLPRMPATDLLFNSMTMNRPFAQGSNYTLGKVTEADVADADHDFRDLDFKLQGHDQYTSIHHSSFNTLLKSHYVRERMKLVEQRDMARRKWLQLRALLDEERSAQRNLLRPANQQQTSSAKAMAFPPKNGNRNLNVQAAAWIPNQGNGVHILPQPAAPNVTKPSIVEKSATHAFKTGPEHLSLAAARINLQAANPLATNRNMQSVISLPPGATLGPYAKQLSSASDDELSDQDVDEWGARRGCAPPELAQKQSEGELKMLSQQRGMSSARVGCGLGNLQANAGNTPMTASPYPVDEWGARVGYAPPELGRQQSEQSAKLEKMHPHQRSQMSIATLDSLPSAKRNAGKTVSFVENANTTYRIGCDSDDDASSVASSDESGWRPMKPGKAPAPTQADWAAMIAAGNKRKGVKTEIQLATGDSIVLEGTRLHGPPFSTANRAGNSDGSRKYQGVMSEQARYGITKQLMSLDRGVRGLEDTARKPCSLGLKTGAFPDENNFFRNKGPSSVAIQSVTAQGTMPGFDSAADRNGQKSLQPLPNSGLKVNGSPSKSNSPLTRSLNDIWSVPPSRRAHVEAIDEEEDMKDVRRAVTKY